MVFGADFGVGQVVWSLLWFFIFVVWIIMVFNVFGDIFRSRDLSGWAKALWTIFVIVLPFLGVLSYMIVRGGKMAQNEARARADYEQNVQEYIRSAAGTNTAADELHKLVDLKDRGVIDDAEFARLKARIVDHGSTAP